MNYFHIDSFQTFEKLVECVTVGELNSVKIRNSGGDCRLNVFIVIIIASRSELAFKQESKQRCDNVINVRTTL